MKFKNVTIANIFAISILILLMLINYFSNENIYEHTWLQAVFYIIPTIVLVILNNTLLIPKLLDNQRFSLYFLILFVCIIITQLITGFFTTPHYFNFKLNVLLTDFIEYFVITIAGFGFIAFMRLGEQQRKNFEQQLLIRQTELNLLKKQINPHFLFNTLNNIYYQCMEGSNQAAEMIEKLSSLMRYTLENTDKESTTLEKEYTFIKNYIDLEKSRLPENSKISLKRKGDFSQVRIAPLILISFIENCFKHSNNLNPIVDIFIEYNAGELLFFCENNINNQPSKAKPSGTGLNNVKKRLEILYPEKHTLNIEKSEEKFAVSLMINTL
jgi:two-component system, LytTR family, sensor kinase